tara:strand:+ start:257 stop:508 length:252 start_codon:yes stop_codon:yes gene_type:complete
MMPSEFGNSTETSCPTDTEEFSRKLSAMNPSVLGLLHMLEARPTLCSLMYTDVEPQKTLDKISLGQLECSMAVLTACGSNRNP